MKTEVLNLIKRIIYYMVVLTIINAILSGVGNRSIKIILMAIMLIGTNLCVGLLKAKFQK